MAVILTQRFAGQFPELWDKFLDFSREFLVGYSYEGFIYALTHVFFEMT